MRRSAYRRAAAPSGGNRRMLAVGAVIAALGAVVAFTTISNAATTDRPQGSDAGKVVNGQTILTDTCVDSTLAPHTGFQDGDRCVSTQFGEVGVAANNPSLLITDAPTSVAVNTPFTLKVSTRNLIRDRFLAAGAGGYYVESSVLKDGIERGHFHTACRMLANTNEAPDPSPVPAFFVATEDTKGGRTPDTVSIQVPGLPSAGTAQCASWAGDGSHRIPMMQRANQTPTIDAVRITVRNGGGNNGGGNTGGNAGNAGNTGGNTGGNAGNNGGNAGNAGNNGGNAGNAGNNGGNAGNAGNTGGNAGNAGNTGGNAGNAGNNGGANGSNGGGTGNGGNTGGGTGNTGGGTGNTGGTNNGGSGNNGGQGNTGATTPPTKAPSNGGSTGGATGPTTKDDFTPNATPPARSSAKPAGTHSTRSTTSGSTGTGSTSTGSTGTGSTGTASAKADEPSSTRTESSRPGKDASDSGAPAGTTAKAAKPKASSSAAAGNYSYSNDDGVPNSGVKAQDLKSVAEPPAARKQSGPLALTGTNTVAFVGGGAVLLLVGLVVMAMTRRRRPSSTWQQ